MAPPSLATMTMISLRNDLFSAAASSAPGADRSSPVSGCVLPMLLHSPPISSGTFGRGTGPPGLRVDSVPSPLGAPASSLGAPAFSPASTSVSCVVSSLASTTCVSTSTFSTTGSSSLSSSTYRSSLFIQSSSVVVSVGASCVLGDGSAPTVEEGVGVASGVGGARSVGVTGGGEGEGWTSASFAGESASFVARILSSGTTLTFGVRPAIGTGAAESGAGGAVSTGALGPPFLPNSN